MSQTDSTSSHGQNGHDIKAGQPAASHSNGKPDPLTPNLRAQIDEIVRAAHADGDGANAYRNQPVWVPAPGQSPQPPRDEGRGPAGAQTTHPAVGRADGNAQPGIATPQPTVHVARDPDVAAGPVPGRAVPDRLLDSVPLGAPRSLAPGRVDGVGEPGDGDKAAIPARMTEFRIPGAAQLAGVGQAGPPPVPPCAGPGDGDAGAAGAHLARGSHFSAAVAEPGGALPTGAGECQDQEGASAQDERDAGPVRGGADTEGQNLPFGTLTAGEEEYRQRAYEAARHYAADYGLAIFPVWAVQDGVCRCRAGKACRDAGKHPYDHDWPAVATPDPDRAARWWRPRPDEMFPTDWRPEANIGAMMGGRHALLDIDTDEDKVGDHSLVALLTHHGEDDLPVTLQWRTGGGGSQHVFLVPEGVEVRNSASRLAPDVDVRGLG